MKQPESFVKAALLTWAGNLKRLNAIFNGMTDDEMLAEVAPGKNRAVYLLGHLTAVNDRMLPLLGFGDREFPQLDSIFITSPDKAVKDLPPIQELRAQWIVGNELLARHFSSLTPDQWLERHTQVSEEDFAKEPHRNKFSVLLSRTSHLAYHTGQLVLLKK
ncbi:MAG: DinB family protein [Puia sp.]|nr:DinB family protein [Puia sp.]